MSNKITEGKPNKFGSVQINFTCSPTFKQKLIELHQEYMRVLDVNIEFNSFIRHLLKQAMEKK